jgi:hypothetical protein
MKRCTRDDVYAFITKAGLQGRTFGEIQRFVVEKNGLDYNQTTIDYRRSRRKSTPAAYTAYIARKYRGYWCVNLLGVGGVCYPRRIGILELGCIKVGKHYVSKKFADLV